VGKQTPPIHATTQTLVYCLFPEPSIFWDQKGRKTPLRTKPNNNQANAETKLKSHQLHFEAAPVRTEIPESESKTAECRSDLPCSATGASIDQGGTTQTEIKK